MRILSIQSAVAAGHVGNAVAVPALQRLGHEVWRIDTVAFSNHPGHGRFRGGVRPPEEVAEMVDGIADHGWFASCDAVLSGYLGAPGTADAVSRAVGLMRSQAASGLYCCDPVIGDHGRVFVGEGVEEAIQNTLAPRADLLTPNVFELGRLIGHPLGDDSDCETVSVAATQLSKRHDQTVAVTGVTRGTNLGVLLVQPGAEPVYAGAACRSRGFNGTGDLFAALLLGWAVKDGDYAAALARSVAGLDLITGLTEERGTSELQLVEALDALADPGRTVALTTVGGV